MIRDPAFYRSFLSMTAVMMLQNVITMSVSLADNIMLGGYSESALSGAAAANQIQFIYQQLLGAAGEGIVVLGGQYFGRKEYGPIQSISAAAMRFALILSIGLFLLMSFFPERILSFFTDDVKILQEGVRYVRLIRFTYPIFAVIQILLAAARSIGIVRIALLLSIASLLINCGFNYTLIYGNFGAPEMGISGAAVGTIIATVMELVLLLIYIRRHAFPLRLSLRNVFRIDPLLCRDYFHVTVPMLLVQGLWGCSNAVQTAVLGHLTAHAIAANSAASTFYLLIKSSAVGSCSAASCFTARTVGEQNPKKLKDCSHSIQLMFVCIGIVTGLLLYALRPLVLSFYHLDVETMVMADQFLIFYAFVQVFMSYQMPTNNGIIRGGGDTTYTLRLDLVSIWCIVIPVSLYAAFIVHAPAIVVLICLNADQFFKCIPAFIKCNFGHWAKKLTR